MPAIQALQQGGASPMIIDYIKKAVPGFQTFIGTKQEIILQALYDRVEYPQAGTTQLNFFASPKGQSATLITSGASGTRTKNLRDTNMDQAGVLSSKGILMYGLCLDYISLSTGITATAAISYIDDMCKIANSGYLELKFIDKPYLQIPLRCIPSSSAFRGAMATTATNTTLIATGGFGPGSLSAPLPVDPPFFITPNENFSVTMYMDGTALSSGNAMDLQLFLVGYMLRPAQ